MAEKCVGRETELNLALLAENKGEGERGNSNCQDDEELFGWLSWFSRIGSRLAEYHLIVG